MLNPGDRCAICGKTDHAEPDLSAELDDAEAIVIGDATVKTEWGVRHDLAADGEYVWVFGTDEHRARTEQRMFADEGPTVLVRRKVTTGPWETVAG